MGKKIPFEEAKKFHMGREKSARLRDEARWSKYIVYDTRWKKNPKKYDYPNIDTPIIKDPKELQKKVDKIIAEEKERKQVRYARTVLLGRSGKLKGGRTEIKTKTPLRGWQNPTKDMNPNSVTGKYNKLSINYGNRYTLAKLMEDEKLQQHIPKDIVNESDILREKREFLRTAKQEITDLAKTEVYTDKEEFNKKIDALTRKHRFISGHIEQKEKEILDKFTKTKRGTRTPEYDVEKLRSLDRKIVYRTGKIQDLTLKKRKIAEETANLTLTPSQQKVVDGKIAKINDRIVNYMKEMNAFANEHKQLQNERIKYDRSGYRVVIKKTVKPPQSDITVEDIQKQLEEKVEQGHVFTFRKMTEGLSDDEKEVFRMFRSIYNKKLLYIPDNKKAFEEMKKKYPNSANAFDIWLQQKQYGEQRKDIPLYLQKPKKPKPQQKTPIGKVLPKFTPPTLQDQMRKVVNELHIIKQDIKNKTFSGGYAQPPSQGAVPPSQGSTPSTESPSTPQPRTAIDKASSGASYTSPTGDVRGSLMQEIREKRKQLREVAGDVDDLSLIMESELNKEQRQILRSMTVEERIRFNELKRLHRARFRTTRPNIAERLKHDTKDLLIAKDTTEKTRKLFMDLEKKERQIKQYDEKKKAEIEKINQMINTKAERYIAEKKEKDRLKDEDNLKAQMERQKRLEKFEEEGGYD